MATVAVVCVGVFGCAREKNRKDRSEAVDMYERICRLTEEYTEKLKSAPDSADWVVICTEFEERLDKISFSYPPDTDLLLTEGQNDTIHALLRELVKVRENRIHGILHPQTELDSIVCVDSLAPAETAEKSIGG